MLPGQRHTSRSPVPQRPKLLWCVPQRPKLRSPVPQSHMLLWSVLQRPMPKSPSTTETHTPVACAIETQFEEESQTPVPQKPKSRRPMCVCSVPQRPTLRSPVAQRPSSCSLHHRDSSKGSQYHRVARFCGPCHRDSRW
jgi:hypothetical protein